MDFIGTPFPGIPMPDVETQSQRSYSYDPMGTLSQQQTHYPELEIPTISNFVWRTPQGSYVGRPQQSDPALFGDVELMKPAFLPQPGWWGMVGLGAMSNNWDDLRREGVGYGLYAPHLPMQPVPVWKLYEAGGTAQGGFVLPATFLGQPLVQPTKPPGT